MVPSAAMLQGLAQRLDSTRPKTASSLPPACSPTSRAPGQVNGSKALPAQASVRGAYINAGSRDAGPDRPLAEIELERRKTP